MVKFINRNTLEFIRETNILSKRHEHALINIYMIRAKCHLCEKIHSIPSCDFYYACCDNGCKNGKPK